MPPRVFRVGKKPDAWARKPPTRGLLRPTNRYDDPLGVYQTIYVASSAYGAFMETMADLRPAPQLKLASVVLENEPTLRSTPPPGQITSWIEGRHLGEASLCGEFVDLASSASLAYLRHRMSRCFEKYEIADFDLSTLVSSKREITQEISRLIFELAFREKRRFAGICYPSRLGHNITCWAIFDEDGTACIVEKKSAPVDLTDHELLRAFTDSRISLGRAEAAS